MLDCVVIAPVVAFLLIAVNPPSDRTGPEKVVLAMSISLSWQMSKLILRQGYFIIHKKRATANSRP
jgi:hypothetical protein